MSAIDVACDVIQPTLESSDPKEVLIGAKCLGLLAGYNAKWKDAPYRINGVECVLTSDLYNPETLRKSRSFTTAGKIDVRATEIATGAEVIFDHKTASQEIEEPNSPYWQQLVIEGQVSHYMLLEWLNENKVDAAIWDVIRKPGIAPKGLAKKDHDEFMLTQTYFGRKFLVSELVGYDPTERRELPLMYAARLAHDCTTERPNWYFQRRKVPRLDSEIHQYGIELWDNGQDLLASRNSGRHPRNSGACFTYNSPCGYLGLCSGRDTLDSGNWTKRNWVHPELAVLQLDPSGTCDRGTDILTNSRIRCFQTCRQKHHYRYELGIERVDEEEKEALFFGNLFHLALEQYFLALQKQQQKGTP